MFGESGDNRTIAPTARRLAEARRRGEFVHSRELTSAVAAFAAALALWWFGTLLWDAALELFAASWTSPLSTHDDRWGVLSPTSDLSRVATLLVTLLGLPVLAVVGINLLQRGFRLRFRFPRAGGLFCRPFSPWRGIGRDRPDVRAGLMLLKLLATGLIAGFAVVRVPAAFAADADLGPVGIAQMIGQSAIVCSLLLTSTFIVLSVIDWFLQRRRFRRELRMTPQEVRDEARERKSPVRSRTHRRQSVSRFGNNSDRVREGAPVSQSAVVERLGN